MKKLIPLLLLTLAACHNSANFSKIKTGMPAKKVTELVGQPESKMPMFGVEWWVYSKENKLVIVSDDTVANVKMDMKASQDSLKMAGEQLKGMLDSIGK
jgi:hypothetical protein